MLRYPLPIFSFPDCVSLPATLLNIFSLQTKHNRIVNTKNNSIVNTKHNSIVNTKHSSIVNTKNNSIVNIYRKSPIPYIDHDHGITMYCLL